MPRSLDLNYPEILDFLGPQLVEGRQESHAMLIWFLENYYRLDETSAIDATVEGGGDLGLDGIYVDENLEQIDIFQSRLFQNNSKPIGDKALRELVGTISQFENPDYVRGLEQTARLELRKLLVAQSVADKIEGGFRIRGIFVTNNQIDANAARFLTSQSNISVYDSSKLYQSYVPSDVEGPIVGNITFDLVDGSIALAIGEIQVLIATVSALQLVQMEGIENQTLFSSNVRQTLGNTNVNRDIGETIQKAEEHENFIMYHNGFTIICEAMQRSNTQLTITNYTVVNGCQSLTTLYDNRDQLTDRMRILCRIILVPEKNQSLVNDITHHTNNQNGITPRDFKSNSSIQLRLQREISRRFDDVFYRIKRGETSDRYIIIDNDQAARNLLAFDVKEPWSCHQTYRLLDDLHDRIFARPEVTADRIVLLADLFEVVEGAKKEIENKPLAAYNLTRYFLLYLLRRAFEVDAVGKQLCLNPTPFIESNNGRFRVASIARTILENNLLVDMNYALSGRFERDEPFDYKREYKNQNSVRKLADEILASYEKDLRRRKEQSFGQLWQE